MRTLLQLLLAGVLLIALSEIQTQIQLGLGLSLANGVETSQQNPQLGTRGGLSPRLGFAAASDTLAQELDTDAEAMGYSGGVVEEPMDEAYAYEESQTQEALPEKEETGSRTGSAAQPVSPFTAMFGETLYRWGDSPNKEEIHEYYTHELLAGQRTIGVYFSASWCAPCRQFTPVLAKFYEEMNKKGKKFEIVWVSRDNSADEFVGKSIAICLYGF